ncbi:metal-dependent transcriptional regulator [Rubellicoccus peritrichatus]|uniref:Transcriptional regulator MntR n=1 Tax=Rubellicoccus peritrichatus TaxID=3080537 RepID=A0AAQ3L7X8_9BACT|nr:metal-dependent transcriptional regulator [Puniceicoccus sp. CR14]WOO40925.1 metal-dependent transcriptional regulator [Puniceicoccus sp. CR14]
MASSTVENYAKEIFLSSQRTGDKVVPMGTVSEALGVSPGTATAMAKKLESDGLAVYKPRAGVSLTDKGRDLAVQMVRRHRLVEYFLFEILKMDWSEIHEEAESLEHAISDRLLARLDTFLGHPSSDPHGDPIPSADGSFSTPKVIPLGECTDGQSVLISRITDQDSAFLHYVSQNELRPGSEIKVIRHDKAGQSVEVQLGSGATKTLGGPAADKILVCVQP